MLKRSTFLAALTGAVVFSSSLIAGEVTKADRDMLVDHLKKTEAAFLKSIDGVSDAQWTWKAAPDRWSVAETAEHITKSEDMLRGMVEGMMKTPAAPDVLAKTKGKEEMILKAIPDRTQKFQAPEPLVPKGTFAIEGGADRRVQGGARQDAGDRRRHVGPARLRAGRVPDRRGRRLPGHPLPERAHRAAHQADRGSEDHGGLSGQVAADART